MNAITLRMNAQVDRERLDRDLAAAIELLIAGYVRRQDVSC
jgi:hypothetical protein